MTAVIIVEILSLSLVIFAIAALPCSDCEVTSRHRTMNSFSHLSVGLCFSFLVQNVIVSVI